MIAYSAVQPYDCLTLSEDRPNLRCPCGGVQTATGWDWNPYRVRACHDCRREHVPDQPARRWTEAV